MKGKVFVGILFILMGVGILFEQIGLWDFGEILSIWWPMFLIAIGLWKLLFNSISKTSGIILILLGVLLQLRTLDIIAFDFMKFFWPIVIIAIGFSILFSKRTRKGYTVNAKVINEDIIHHTAIFSGIEVINHSQHFTGGSLVAAFGGIDADLKNVTLAEDGATLEVTSVFGGVDIIVPRGYKVVIKGIPIFGGWSNETMDQYDDDKKDRMIMVNCFVAFGGINVKN